MTKMWFSFKSQLNQDSVRSRPKVNRLIKKVANCRAASEKKLSKKPFCNQNEQADCRKNQLKAVLKPSEFLKKTPSKPIKKFSIKTSQDLGPHMDSQNSIVKNSINLPEPVLNKKKILPYSKNHGKIHSEDINIVNSHHSYHTSNASVEFEKCMAEIDKLKQQSENNALEKSSSGWKSELESDEESPPSNYKEISSAINILNKANLLSPINLNLLENLFQLVSDPEKECYARSYLKALTCTTAENPIALKDFTKKTIVNELESTGPNSGDYSAVSFETSLNITKTKLFNNF